MKFERKRNHISSRCRRRSIGCTVTSRSDTSLFSRGVKKFHVLGLKNEEYSSQMSFLFTCKLCLRCSEFYCNFTVWDCIAKRAVSSSRTKGFFLETLFARPTPLLSPILLSEKIESGNHDMRFINKQLSFAQEISLSLIHIWRCRRRG